MGKKLKIKFSDNGSFDFRCQRVWSDDCKNIRYTVCDLYECPEDATIDRDLFSGDEYIEAIELGMDLAKEGYTEIEVEDVPFDE